MLYSTILKNKLGPKKPERWYEIAVAGSVILVTGQLIGALCGVMFPIWFGQDTSDFSLSSRPINFDYEYNSELIKYNHADWINATPDLIFTSKIYATNVHPLRDYNQQIYLEVLTPYGINSSTDDFAIKAGNYTTLYIYTYNKSALYPGRYTIIVRGIGGDGKSRECKLFLDIYKILHSVGSSSDELTNISIKTTGEPHATVDSLKILIRSRIEPDNQLVRHEALKLAGRHPGDRTIDQLCSIYDTMRYGDGSLNGWRFVSDPRGMEYFNYANESLKIGKAIGCVGAGDSDDLAILISSLAESIGATTRIVLAFNSTSRQEHAYTEVYLGKYDGPESDAQRMLSWLRKNYNLEEINTHTDLTNGDVWLNLDWQEDEKGNAHPGGPFFQGNMQIVIYLADAYEKSPLNLPDNSLA